MTGFDVASVRARCNAATAAPWTVIEPLDFDNQLDADWWVMFGVQNRDSTSMDRADAEFIAAARSDLPNALDEVERLRDEHAKCHDTHERMVHAIEFRTAERDALRTALDAVLALCDEYEQLGRASMPDGVTLTGCVPLASAIPAVMVRVVASVSPAPEGQQP